MKNEMVALKLGQHIRIDDKEFIIGGFQFTKDMQGYSINIFGIDPLIVFKRKIEEDNMRAIQKQMCDQFEKLNGLSDNDESDGEGNNFVDSN